MPLREIWWVGMLFCSQCGSSCFCNNYGESGLVLCVMRYRVFLPWSHAALVFISVGSQSRQKHASAEEFHTNFTLFGLLLSFLLCRQGTRSPTVWTAGTHSAGPRWRWAPTADSSPSRVFLLSRHTCSDSSLARLWAGVSNWKLWSLPQSAEVSQYDIFSHFPSFLVQGWYCLTRILCFYISMFLGAACDSSDVHFWLLKLRTVPAK